MKKKEFSGENPALAFISQETHHQQSTQYAHNVSNTHIESKSKRVSLLIYPSVHKDLSKIAYIDQCSVNDLICRALRDYAKQHQEKLLKYDDFVK